MSLLVEHLWMASPAELWDLHEEIVGHRPGPADGRVLVAHRIKKTIEQTPSMNRLRASFCVAGCVIDRWRLGGITHWRRDELGVPTAFTARDAPHPHRWVFAFRLSPSGKALFVCTGCDAKAAPVTGPLGPCPGRRLHGGSASYPVARAVFGGIVYQPNHYGLMSPTVSTLRACTCCWNVGPWVERDPLCQEVVCPACREDAKALTRAGATEIEAAVYGRMPTIAS